MIAIGNNSSSLTKGWIEFCELNLIPYKIVNPYEDNIIKQLDDCQAFLWHFHHANYYDLLYARQLLFALDHAGKCVFPDFKTAWHFDDKISQKYLLEALNVPFVDTKVFYSKEKALEFIKITKFPIVFKLRGGAGSSNVSLIKNLNDANRIVRKMFKSGIRRFNNFAILKEGYQKFLNHRLSFKGLIYKNISFLSSYFSYYNVNENGYVYFQSFLADNSFDTRIIVIGDKAFGLVRLNRNNDFRASGSGSLIYDKERIDIECVKIAFNVNELLKSQCIAFDFIFNNGIPNIVEISYGFSAQAYESCEGYWDTSLNWHSGRVNICEWIISDILERGQMRNK